jgi:hypothetical protein
LETSSENITIIMRSLVIIAFVVALFALSEAAPKNQKENDDCLKCVEDIGGIVNDCIAQVPDSILNCIEAVITAGN